MSQVLKFIGVVLIAWGAGASAMAAPVVSVAAAGQVNTTVAGATIVDFNAGCGYLTCSGDYKIVSGSASGLYAQPLGINSPYLTVPNPSATTHTAEFGLGTTANYFGLFWGSIDDYNNISFYRNNIQVANFSGSDIVGQFANGSQLNYSANRYINFDFGNDMYDTVRLGSSGFAFESDNHAYVASAFVPEPVNLVLMGLGVFGLFAARRLQRK